MWGERYRWSTEPDTRGEKQQQSQRSLMKILSTPGESDADPSRRCDSRACLCAALSHRACWVFFRGARAGCRNLIGQPVGFRGAHAARCKLCVLSKIIGYPKLIIAAKSYTKQW